MFVGGVLQVLIQLPPLLRLGLVRLPRWNWRHEGVKRITKLMGPAIIGSSMGQLSIIVSQNIATYMAAGSVSWLYYADRIVEFPLGVFSIALATVILPSLSAHHGLMCENRPGGLGDCTKFADRAKFAACRADYFAR